MTVTRYLTRGYCALTRADAERHAALDHISPAEIRVAENVELLHLDGSGSWAWWSDGKLTTSIGLPPDLGAPQALSAAAVELIGLARGAESGRPAIGWRRLAEVSEILERVDLAWLASRGHYAGARVMRLVVRYLNGETGDLYVYSEGYCEGYEYRIESTEADLRRYLAGEAQ